MTTLVLGANGQLGRLLPATLAPLGRVVCATRTGLLADGSACETADFTLPQSLPPLLARIRPACVVNAAAYTAVDRAEQEHDLAFMVNAQAPAAIAQWCAAQGVPLVHYSTDYVFDGQASRPYRPSDPTRPLGVYGASKLAGEEAIRAAGGQHLIFRTAWVYAAQGQNFLRTMLRLAGERDTLRVVADQVGTPTSAELIADITAKILASETKMTGIWHLTASGQTSWHGFAEALLARAHDAGLIGRLPQVMPIATADYPTAARRPAYSCLDCSSLMGDFQVELPEWQQGMDAVIRHLASMPAEDRRLSR